MGGHRKSAGRMIREAMWRQMRPKVLFLGIVLICGTFLIGIDLYRSISTYKNIKKAEDRYGDWQVVYQMESEEAGQILCESETTEYAYKRYLEDLQTTKGQMWIAAMEESSMEHEGTHLVEGRFPSAADEVLCSREYLLRNGLDFGAGREPVVHIERIEVNGDYSPEIITIMPGEEEPERKEVRNRTLIDTYKIVGIYESTSYHATSGVIYFIRNLEYYKPRAELLYDRTELRMKPEYQPWTDLFLVVRYPKYKGYGQYPEDAFAEYGGRGIAAYGVNASVLEYSNIDMFGRSKSAALRLVDSIKYIMAALMAALITAVIIVTSSPVKKSVNLFHALGIALKELILCQFWMAFRLIVSTAMVFSALDFIVSYIVIQKASWIETVSDSLRSLSVIWAFVIMCAALYSLYLLRFYHKRSWNAADSLQVKKKMKTPKTDSELIRYKKPFMRLADKNRRMNGGERFIRVVSLAVTMGIVSFLLYFMPTTGIGYPINDYTHRIEFYRTNTFDIMQSKTEAMEDAYHRLVSETEGYKIYSYYGEHQTLQVAKSSLSEEYIDYLMETKQDAIYEFRYSGTKNYNMAIRVLFADSEILKKTYRLTDVEVPKQGECILVRNVGIPGEPTYATGLSVGDVLKDPFEGEYGDCPDLTITQVVDNVDLPYKRMYGEQMIIISKEEGIKRFDRVDCPDYIFFSVTDPEAESKINSILSGVADMDLLNIEEEIRKEKQDSIEFATLMTALFVLLMALVFCHLLLTMWSKVNEERPQSAALYALGVPMRIIKKSIFLEYGEILLEASVLGVVLGYVAGFLVRLYIRENYFYCSLHVSWPEAVLPALAMGLLGLVLLFPLMRSMERMNIRKELQEEDK